MSKSKGGGDQRTPAERELAERQAEDAGHMHHMAEEAGAGPGSTASIFRQEVVLGRPIGKPPGRFLETVPADQIWDRAYEYLDERWGGGFYAIKLKHAGGNFIAGMPTLKYELEGKAIPKDPEADGKGEARKLDELEAKVTAALEGGGKEASTTDLVRFMMEITREQLREVRNPPAAAAQANPAEMAVNMMTAIQAAQAPLLAALIERASAPAPDTVAQMRGMVEMMGLMRDLSGQGDGNRDGWSRIVDKLADPLGQMFNQHVANQAAGTAPPATYAGPRLVNPGAPPALEAPPMDGTPEWLQMIGPYLPQLLAFAQAKRDPAITADFIAEGVPEDALGMLYEHVTSAGSPAAFLDAFVGHVPDAAPHREWFSAFFGRVLQWVGTPPEESQPEDGTPEVGTVAGADAAP